MLSDYEKAARAVRRLARENINAAVELQQATGVDVGEVVREAVAVATVAREAALAEPVEAPSWLPSWLRFDLDGNGRPDLTDPEVWSNLADVVCRALLTFAAPHTVAYRAAEVVMAAKADAITSGAFALVAQPAAPAVEPAPVEPKAKKKAKAARGKAAC